MVLFFCAELVFEVFPPRNQDILSVYDFFSYLESSFRLVGRHHPTKVSVTMVEPNKFECFFADETEAREFLFTCYRCQSEATKTRTAKNRMSFQIAPDSFQSSLFEHIRQYLWQFEKFC